MAVFSKRMELLEDRLCHWKNGLDLQLKRKLESSEGKGVDCTVDRFSDECFVNPLADGRAVASNEDGGNTSPDVGPSPCKISTAVNLQVAHLQLGPPDTHRMGCGQPPLAKGIMVDNGTATASKKKH